MTYQHTKSGGVSPILLSVLSTSLSLLVNQEELNRAVDGHMAEIRRLSAKSDRELATLGITRDQITAYVLHESE